MVENHPTCQLPVPQSRDDAQDIVKPSPPNNGTRRESAVPLADEQRVEEVALSKLQMSRMRAMEWAKAYRAKKAANAPRASDRR